MSNQKDILKDWVKESLRQRGGEANLIDIAKDIWAGHEKDLRQSGNLFFTWQYDMRWAGTALRRDGQLEDAARGRWKLVAGR
jgi:hypothetical protein